MKLRMIALAVLTAVALPVPASAANLVTNGSFENVTATDKSFFSSAGVAGWSGGLNLTFLDYPGTADDLSKYLTVYGPFPATSPDGGNFVEADGDPNYSGAIYQTINGLTAGKKYNVDFYQAAGQQYGFTGPTTERWSVTFGAENQLSTVFSLPEAGVGLWMGQHMTFTATSASQVLSFLAVGTPGGAPPISFLDGISLQAAVPEPATWGLILVGFGALGITSRRRRRAEVAA